MRPRPCFSFFFVVPCAILIANVGLAQNPIMLAQKGPAFIAPPKSDPNYQLMGEFYGKIRVEGQKKKRQAIALQIRPIAGNRFNAIAYRGGLPGQPNHNAEEMNLIGLRSQSGVILSGGPWAIFVDPAGCNIVSSGGKLLGRLERVLRVSPTLGAKAPQGATVLFDGTNVDSFVNAEMTDDGLLKQGALISPMLQDFCLHVEFRLPYMPRADGQQRGNSGLYLQSRYECQVLDSFGTEKMFNGLGALYRFKAPDVNMAFPPLRWQTYDVHFTAPRWASDGSKIRDARITSWVNGVKVQDDVALPNKTGAGKPEAPMLSPINIQDHGDPVRFRNIWIVDRGLTNVKFPINSAPKVRAEAAKLEWESGPEPKEEVKEETPSESPKAAEPEPDEKAKAEADPKKEVKSEKPKAVEPKSEPKEEAPGKSDA